MQAQGRKAPPPILCLLTSGAQWSGRIQTPSTAAAWGLARATRAEAELPVLCVDGSSVGHGASIVEPEIVVSPTARLRRGSSRRLVSRAARPLLVRSGRI